MSNHKVTHFISKDYYLRAGEFNDLMNEAVMHVLRSLSLMPSMETAIHTVIHHSFIHYLTNMTTVKIYYILCRFICIFLLLIGKYGF